MNKILRLSSALLLVFAIAPVYLQAQIVYPLADECGVASSWGDETSLLGTFDNKLVFYNQSNSNDRSLWVVDANGARQQICQPRSSGALTLVARGTDSWYFREARGDSSLLSVLSIGSDTLLPIHVAPEGEDVRNVAFWNNELYFEQTTGLADETLERLNPADGTQTTLFTSDFGGIRGIGTLNDYVMFVANTDDGKKLFRTDGTVAGTEEVLQLYDAGSSFSNSLRMTSNGEKLFFFYHPNNNPRNLWVTDGTTAGTQLLKAFDSDINGLPPRNATFLGDLFIFIAREDGVPSGGTFDVHASDGTPEGTINLNPFGDGYMNSRLLTHFNDRIYFSSIRPGNWGIYSTDGTVANTGSEIPAYGDIRNLFHIGTFQDSLVFGGSEDPTGQELYISDGTPEGSRLLADIVEGEDDSNPSQFLDGGDKLYFLTAPTSTTREIWIYDPAATTAPSTSIAVVDSTIVDFESPTLGSATFTFEGGTPPYSFSLNGGDITTESTFEDLAPGDYELLVTDQNGCSITVPFTVDEVVGTNDFISPIDAFKVFPNPAQAADQVSVTFSSTRTLENPVINISNALGQVVKTVKVGPVNTAEMSVAIPVADMETGTYWISLQEGSNTLFTTALLKQ